MHEATSLGAGPGRGRRRRRGPAAARRPAGRVGAGAHQDRSRPRDRRGAPARLRQFRRAPGRCIYGGIFEEGSPLADADGFRRDVMEAARGLGVTLLRWPGGNFASGYNWKDGIGPRDQRPVRRDHAWDAIESNRFGTDEFLRYAERLGVEPYLCINAGLGSVEDARNWVEYTNGTQKTYWADQRRKNGRDRPWGVKVWGLGNEIDGPWQLGHKNAEDYAKFALEAAKAMRRA